MTIKPTTIRKTAQWYVVMKSVKRPTKHYGYLARDKSANTVGELVFTGDRDGGWRMAKQTANSFVTMLTQLLSKRSRVYYEIEKA